MLKSVKRILVAKLRHHGDVLLSSPVFHILKDTFPSAQIDAYIYKETLPMLEDHPSIDGFLLYDKSLAKQGLFKKLSQEARLLYQIYKNQYDLVINLTEGDRGAIAAKVSRAKAKVGFDPERSGMLFKKSCYTHVVRICHQTRHTVERQLDALRVLGIFPKQEQKELVFSISSETRLKVTHLLKENGIAPYQYILVHPVSRWLFKCLPEKTVAEVVDYLAMMEKKVVLTASKDPLECSMNQKILSLVKHPQNVVDLSGQTSLKELGALIELSQLLFCVDSVPMHIASALKAPVLAVFGPTSEKTWAPWLNPHATVLAQNYSCRPCYMPGCGGCQKSDCLETFSSEAICVEIVKALSHIESGSKLKILSEISRSSNGIV